MPQVSFEEFKKLWKRIPQDRLEHVHFFPLTRNKLPLKGISWKDSSVFLNYYQIKNNYMGQGWNIGVVARPKGIMFLDIDTDDKSQLMVSNEVLQAIPQTFTVRTRSKGLHFYFLNDGEWNNQRFTIDGKDVGELRTDWQYVVSPGSWVMPATYRVINDIPIVKFEGDITKYFEKGRMDKPEKPATLHGKTGKPLTQLPEKYRRDLPNELRLRLHDSRL